MRVSVEEGGGERRKRQEDGGDISRVEVDG